MCWYLFKPTWALVAFQATDKSESLEFVKCDLENDAIESCLGDAGVVVCTIGASEKEISDVTGPYRIDYKATENLIKAGK